MMDQAQNLRDMMGNKGNAKVITVTSGKGGVGKSSISLNLAIELSRRGEKVLLIDSDFGFSNIDIMLGVSTKYNLSHVLNRKKEVTDIIECGIEGVQFISGGSGLYDLISMDGFQISRLLNSFRRLDSIADIIIFDTGSGLSENILRMIYASHETILVTTPEPTSITDAYALLKIACRQKNKPNIQLLMNKAKNKKEADAAMNGFVKVVDSYMDLKVKKLGYILRDENMANAVKIQQPLMVSFPKSNAALNIKDIVDGYLNMPKEDHTSFGIRNFFDRLVSRYDEDDEEKIEYLGAINDIESSG